jgi:hypothetical protein
MQHFDGINPLFGFEQQFNSINQRVLADSNYKYDLGNFINSDFTISTSNIRGIINKDVLPNAKSFIDDALRTEIASFFKNYNDVPKGEAETFIKKILRRTVLYVGSECERQEFIGVEAEYDDLSKVLVSEFMELNRVFKPSIKNLLLDWEKYKPSIIFISCHGEVENLFLQDDMGNCKAYNNTDLVGFFKKRLLYTECVVLSACESETLGKLIIESCRNVVCINRSVDIITTRLFCNVFMEYLNDHSLDNNDVYEHAFKLAESYVKIEGLKDGFAFKFLKSDLKQ